MDIKYTKSIFKSNPDSKDLPDLLSFVPLFILEKGKITIHPRGLKIIETQVVGKLHLVALEGHKQNLLYSLYRSNKMIRQERKTSGIWISTFPRYDKQRNISYLYLETAALNSEERIKIHIICSLICSCIVIDLEEHNLSFITSVQGRVIYSRRQNNQRKNKEHRKIELANLALLEIQKGPFLNSTTNGTQQHLFDILNKLNIFHECTEIYKSVNLISCFVQELQKFNLNYLQNLQNQIKQICAIQPNKTQDLMIGPILSWYIEKVIQTINNPSGGIIQIQKCVGSIEVTQGYNAFVKASQVYVRRISLQIKEEGLANPKETLMIAREEATQQYKNYSLDAQYLVLLGEYIDSKQKLMIEQNNKILDLKNISYLKVETDALLSKIARQKMSEEVAQKQIDMFVERYKANSSGDNKFEILTNYLKYLNAAVYKTVNEKQSKRMKREVQISKKQKQQLQERIKEMQKAARPPENKCCIVM